MLGAACAAFLKRAQVAIRSGMEKAKAVGKIELGAGCNVLDQNGWAGSYRGPDLLAPAPAAPAYHEVARAHLLLAPCGRGGHRESVNKGRPFFIERRSLARAGRRRVPPKRAWVHGRRAWGGLPMCPTAFVFRTTLRGQKPGYLCGAGQLLEFAVSYALTPIS